MTVVAGSQIGPFEVVSRLGAGGMGEVFRARDPRIGRDVAIKVLPSEFAHDALRLRRFQQEANAAGSLSHPNLVTIFEFGTHAGAPYIAMELLKGRTLREMIRATDAATPPFAPRKAVEIAMQIGNGLAAAHEKGLVHRDLKPENIFVTDDGLAKILDFGIVKLSPNLDLLDSVQPTVPKSSPGSIVGTVGYMSPEQVRGEEVDHRSDIFALGAVLYEMLGGQRAFRGATAIETMNSILKDDPPPFASTTSVPLPLDRIVRRCLEKEPRRRFESTRDVVFALEAIGDLSSGAYAPLREQRPRPGSKAVWLAAVAAAAACLAIAGAYIGRRTAGSSPASAPTVVPMLTRLTWEEGTQGAPSIAPDGASFAYVADTQLGNSDIFLRRIGGETAINLTKDCLEEDTMPAFSPDGRSIAFRSARDGGGIFIMGATGESVRRLTDFGFDPAWSPDGSSIAVSTGRVYGGGGSDGNGEIWIVDVQSGAKKRVFEGDAVFPAFSPSGARIAFYRRFAGSNILSGRAFATVAVSGGDPVNVMEFDDSAPSRPVWTRNGLILPGMLGGMLGLWRASVDERTGTPQGNAEQIFRPTGWAVTPTADADERKLLFPIIEGATTLRRYALRETPSITRLEGRTILRTARDLRLVALSPDGEWLCTILFDQDQQDIVLVRASTGESRRLTNDRLREIPSAFSPDGAKIYFFGGVGEKTEIWSIRPDGSGRELVARAPDGESALSALPSPDGRWLYVWLTESRHGGRSSPYVADLSVPAEQRKLIALPPMADGRALNFLVSPDGRRLAGHAMSSGPPDTKLYVYDVATKSYRAAGDLNGAGLIGWLPDSRRVLAVSGETLSVLDTESGAITPAGRIDGLSSWGRAAISSDGRSLITSDTTSEGGIWMLDRDAMTPITLAGTKPR